MQTRNSRIVEEKENAHKQRKQQAVQASGRSVGRKLQVVLRRLSEKARNEAATSSLLKEVSFFLTRIL